VWFFGAPGLNSDFASFSFQVPVCALSAKHNVALAKHSAPVRMIAFALMRVLVISPAVYAAPFHRDVLSIMLRSV
jgi:hypothetical protein